MNDNIDEPLPIVIDKANFFHSILIPEVTTHI